MPVERWKASEALRSVSCGEAPIGFPSLSKKEQSIVRVGISAKGSRKAVE